MATYTMSVRTISEQIYLENHPGMKPEDLAGVPISTIISNTAEQVIPESFPVWANGTTTEVKSAIIRHYWMREIGLETVAYWQYAISTRLQEIMPWYADAHNRMNAMGDIFDNQGSDSVETMEHGEKITKSGTDTTTLSQTQTDGGTVENSGTTNTDTESQRSDTPQNGLTSVKAGQYLTEAGVGNEVQTLDNTETRNLTRSTNGTNGVQYGSSDTHSGTDTRTVKRNGFAGDKVLTMKEFMDAHMNIMKDIILSVSDCFMGIIG